MISDKTALPSPAYILDEKKLESNLQLLKHVSENAEIDIILAFKGFALWNSFPLVRKYLSGATASSLHENLLCNEHFKTKSHTYAVAYKADEIDQLLEGSSHISFNSINQYNKFKEKAKAAKVSIGLRINPEYSDVATEIYNPSSPSSRLGITKEALINDLPPDVEGLHFHVLCESNSYALEKTLHALEANFGKHLSSIKWLNIGGGHLITHKEYDTTHLIDLLKRFRTKYDLSIIMEPGSAVAWEAGTLRTTILDIINNGGVTTAIIDASFTCHMPDCLEMPYKPKIRQGSLDFKKGQYQYRLGGISCLAGDFLEAYSFEEPLKIGDEIEFLDMMHYTMVKTSTFNGIQHPAIAIERKNGTVELIRAFSYDDYKNRLS